MSVVHILTVSVCHKLVLCHQDKIVTDNNTSFPRDRLSNEFLRGSLSITLNESEF